MNTKKIIGIQNDIHYVSEFVFVEWKRFLLYPIVSINFYDSRLNPYRFEIFDELGLTVKYNNRTICYDTSKEKPLSTVSCTFSRFKLKKFIEAMKLLQIRIVNDKKISIEDIKDINDYIFNITRYSEFINIYDII